MVNLSYGWKANLVALAVTPPAVLLRAYVTAAMWAWFVVPFGLPALGLAHAWGLWYLVNLMTAAIPPVKDKEIVDADGAVKREATPSEARLWVVSRLAGAVAPSLLALLFGYVAHYLMVH